jgi:sensor histidine kinase YesM
MAAFYLIRMLFVVVRERAPLADFWPLARQSFFGRNLIDMIFYWVVIGYGYTSGLLQRVKNEELKAAQLESRLMEAELKALKQQLHPHFLFNTMNTIAVLVREKRNDEAVQLIAKLSTLLRISLDNTRVHEVTLRQEMDFLERYLEIQQLRFGDRLQVRTAISAQAMEARIPNLLLQPLVENAVLHGVAPKNAPGVIEIKGEVRGERLHLEVHDDGAGFVLGDGGRLKEGIGLTNTRERLAKIYGPGSQLILRSDRNLGTTVQIILPCRT